MISSYRIRRAVKVLGGAEPLVSIQSRRSEAASISSSCWILRPSKIDFIGLPARQPDSEPFHPTGRVQQTGRTGAIARSLLELYAVAKPNGFVFVRTLRRSAATEDGARSMVSLGFHPAGFGADKLWMQGVLRRPEKQVA